MNKSLYFAVATSVALALGACDNGDQTIGSSLVEDQLQVVIADSFPVTGRSLLNEGVQGRTITQLLGSIQAEGYGSLTSDFVCQFMPAQNLPDTLTLENFDSIRYSFAIPWGSAGGFIGDSIAPMGLEVFRLDRQLPFPIFSDFSPEGYFNPSLPIGQAIYACNPVMTQDTVSATKYDVLSHQVNVRLPDELGRELITLYREHPEVYSLPTEFARHFPGLYVRNTYGSGRVVKIGASVMQMFYHTFVTDTLGVAQKVKLTGTYFAVSPEVINNNNIAYDVSPSLTARVDSGQNIIIAPAGRDVELTFPTRELLDYYHTNGGDLSVFNTLTFKVPAQAIANDYGIAPPPNLLMVLSSKKKDFFLKNDVTNDKISFQAVYDEKNKQYYFTDLRNYFIDILKREANLTPDDYTFTLTPVTLVTESNNSNYYYGTATTYISAITPYVETPTMCRLLLDKAKVTITFSKQTVK